MSKNIIAPPVRFQGFTAPWRQRKFADLATVRRGLTYKPHNVIEGGKRVLRSSNINEDAFQVHHDDVFVDENVVNIPYVNNGDILITSANGSSRLIGKHAIIRDIPENSAVHGGFMLLASSDESEFVNALMSSPWYKKFINAYVAGGNGAIGNLNKNDLDEQIAYVPQKEEMHKIGDFFGNLDHLITLHQRKIDQLKKIKKYFLQKMFPAKGEKLPKIRFMGFTGDWKERKLGDISSLNGRIGFRGYTQKDIITKEEGGILTFSPTNIIDNRLIIGENNTYITQEKFDESPEIKIKNGDILFVKTGSTLGKSCLISNLWELASINPQIVVIRTSPLFRQFLSVQLTSDLIQKQVATVKIGGAVPTMTEAQIKQFDISIPSDEHEVAAIGDIFIRFDNVISLYQRKLDQLKTMKKYFLQNMFI